ncbi:hypothetical protein Sme01_24280 [Sphaerisporangium melleum]|uniref:Uncharacterized protein n=1 Tax=Sphaerisporangium melleum TaxID=321316 RepID=A0A917QS97_9ACTN|nr:hypothetical protein [Sphaerisporangium melleum]GGK65488.1 hypothetical protein GCM10007964_05650 [Sphaerisporangium melleum]GII69952.1 hypothetical protein Sme01_24280 [Sphaerisporangium melleum]
MRNRTLHRVASGLTGVALAATAFVSFTQPASAYTCSGGKSTTLNASDGVGSADITFYPKCSDGKAHWSGTIRDTKCDARAARIIVQSIWSGVPGTPAWSYDYEAPNGCNTGRSFSGSAAGMSGNWRIELYVGACNSTSCSSYTYGSLAYNSA